MAHGADLEEPDEQGATPLHVAAVCGRVEAVKVLVELGAEMEAKMGHEATPLHVAAQFGQVELSEAIKALVELGADKEAKNDVGGTPMHEAVFSGYDARGAAAVRARAAAAARGGHCRPPLRP